MIIYDVRTKEEFDLGSAPGAINLPLQEIELGNFPEVSKEEKIYVHCRSGARSARAREILIRNGFTNTENLGGLSDAIRFVENH